MEKSALVRAKEKRGCCPSHDGLYPPILFFVSKGGGHPRTLLTFRNSLKSALISAICGWEGPSRLGKVPFPAAGAVVRRGIRAVRRGPLKCRGIAGRRRGSSHSDRSSPLQLKQDRRPLVGGQSVVHSLTHTEPGVPLHESGDSDRRAA